MQEQLKVRVVGRHAQALRSRAEEGRTPRFRVQSRAYLPSPFARTQALQQNNHPYIDHGVEVMYRCGGCRGWESAPGVACTFTWRHTLRTRRFADFDPFNPRTLYFGRRMDLGQFERFR